MAAKAVSTARLSPFGLTGFGLSTLLLGLLLSGLLPPDSLLLTAAVFPGAVLQIGAGGMAMKRGNAFDAILFLSFGFFWMSLIALLFLPLAGWGTAAPSLGLGVYLVLWGLFAVALLLDSVQRNLALQLMFATLVLVLLLLGATLLSGLPALRPIAGMAGVLCSLIAFYIGLAEAVNSAWGRRILPLGKNGAS